MASRIEDIILPKHSLQDPTRGKVPETSCWKCLNPEVVFGARHMEHLRRFVLVYGCTACGQRWTPDVDTIDEWNVARINNIGSEGWHKATD
jgi:DNA-directed RNA polymerase subunit M/transcription elongation factor TFIIS